MELKVTYLHHIVSWVSVLITHRCGVGVKWRRAVIKVPQALHKIGSGCDRRPQGHRLIDEGVLRRCIQDCSSQQVLHQDVLGDVLSMQCVEAPQVNGQ